MTEWGIEQGFVMEGFTLQETSGVLFEGRTKLREMARFVGIYFYMSMTIVKFFLMNKTFTVKHF